jgi:hypothetical protein
MTGVPSITKMYRTPANSEIHSVLHFAEKTKVYSVHFDLKKYTLLQRVMHTIELKNYIQKSVDCEREVY